MEAKYYPIEQYMQYVEAWYQQQQKQGMNVTQKRVYLATDEADVLEVATKKCVVSMSPYLTRVSHGKNIPNGEF